jgi:Bacterial Ig-like domain (group 2)
MTHRRLPSRWNVVPVFAVLAACAGDGTGPNPNPGNPTIAFSQSRVAIPLSGDAQLFVLVTDGDGNIVPNPSVSWESSNTSVVTVSQTGQVTAVNTGTASITATYEDVSQSVNAAVVASATFGADVQPIFTANCALSGCHAGPSPQQAMDLSAGKAYANIVNVHAMEANLDRVEPGDPEASYLLHKIQGTQSQAGGSGGRMPQNADPLPQGTIDIVRAWIQSGAADN